MLCFFFLWFGLIGDGCIPTSGFYSRHKALQGFLYSCWGLYVYSDTWTLVDSQAGVSRRHGLLGDVRKDLGRGKSLGF